MTVDGTVHVGIQNVQQLTIDGTINGGALSLSTPVISNGITWSWDLESVEQNLINELNADYALEQAYSLDPTLEAAYQAQVDEVQSELSEYTDSNGVVDQNPMVYYVTVSDIWCQSSNIHVTAEVLTGSSAGAVDSPGNAAITIINNSPAYLRLGEMTIPTGTGGNLFFNGAAPTSLSGITALNYGQQSAGAMAVQTSADSQAPPSPSPAPSWISRARRHPCRPSTSTATSPTWTAASPSPTRATSTPTPTSRPRRPRCNPSRATSRRPTPVRSTTSAAIR